MGNFEFHAPTRVVFGQQQISKLGELIPAKARVLLLYGQGSIKKNGAYDEVKQALLAHELFEFCGIAPNPEYETLLEALAIIKKNNIDFILSVGGGSIIDAGKFLAAAACFVGDPWEIVLSGGKLIHESLPHGAVLTLPAAGSEMNRWAVITRCALKIKRDFTHPSLFLRFVIMDPTKTFSLPPKQICNGIIDACVHVLEQYVTLPMDAPLHERQAEAVLLTLIEQGRRILRHPDDYQARANFMWAATAALNGHLDAGIVSDWTAHIIGHELTALYGLAHAESLAVLVPATFKILRMFKRERLIQYGRNIWHLNDDDPEVLITNAIQATEDFFVEVGAIVRLRYYGIDKNDFSMIANKIEAQGLLPLGERRNVDKELIIKILEAAY
jgi:NADP-dependent alcohol dehydrogenase